MDDICAQSYVSFRGWSQRFPTGTGLDFQAGIDIPSQETQSQEIPGFLHSNFQLPHIIYRQTMFQNNIVLVALFVSFQFCQHDWLLRPLRLLHSNFQLLNSTRNISTSNVTEKLSFGRTFHVLPILSARLTPPTVTLVIRLVVRIWFFFFVFQPHFFWRTII